MTTADGRVDVFETLRPHLLTVAYRLTGSFADAEDAVQDAWLRWDRTGEPVADPPAWLTTVVSRLCLDRLRSAAHRRETYTGPWLPEPVVTHPGETDPLGAVVADEEARFAAMVVLERLGPAQRVAFVLHDGFGVPFGEVADVLDVTAATARQLASRARKLVSDAPAPTRHAGHEKLVARLLAAMADGDLAAVVDVLHPDVTFTGDANRHAPTAAQVIRGSDKVARFLFGLAARYGPAFHTSARLVLVNGDLGFYTPGTPAGDGFPAMAPHIVALTVRDDGVSALWDIANPDKFSASPLRGQPENTS